MAKKQLSPDYIEWCLKLNSTQAQDEYHKLEKENKELQKQTAATRKAMVQLEAEGKKNTAEWKNLRNSIKLSNETMAENKAKMEKVEERIKTTDLSINQLKKSLKSYQQELNSVSKAQDPQRWEDLSQKVKKYKNAINEATGATKSLWEKLKSIPAVSDMMLGGLWSIGSAVTNYVVGSFKQAKSTIQDFEAANAKLAAILGTNIAGISSLTEQAKFLGKTTTFTASQVTDLQTELAKLGFATDSIEAMTPAVLKFSQAVDADLGSAAAFGGAALRIFGKDASETEDVLASFAIATTKSSLDFRKLETALSTVGPVAASFGLTVEDTTALLGQLANAGFDASSSATATRNILLTMADSSGDLAKALGGPVSTLDEMVEGFRKLNAQGVDLAKALDLTDKQSVAAFKTFLEGTDTMIELRDSITGCAEDFNTMADTMTDTGAGASAGLESAMEGLLLKFFDLRSAIKAAYEAATEVVMWFGEVLDIFAPLGKGLMTVIGLFGKFIGLIGSCVKWLTQFVGQSALGKAALNALVVAVISFRVASMLTVNTLKSWITAIRTWIVSSRAKIAALAAETTATNIATAATNALNTAWKSNPIGLVVTGLAALTAGLLAYKSEAKEAAEETDALSQAEKKYQDAITEANVQLETQKDKIEKLVKIQNDETLAKEERLDAIKKLNSIIPGYNAQLDEETGKVRANSDALREYIGLLRKKLQLEANRDYYKDLLAEDEKTKRDMYGVWKDRDKLKGYTNAVYGNAAKYGEGGQQSFAKTMIDRADKQAEMNFSDWYEAQNTPSSRKLKEHEQYMKEQGMALEDEPGPSETTTKTTSTAGGKKSGKKGGKGGGSSAPKKDPIKEATAKADADHRAKDLDIEKMRNDLEEADYIIKKNEEVIAYCNNLAVALAELKDKTKASDKDLLEKIAQEMDKVELEALKAQDAVDAAKLRKAKEFHEKSSEALTAALETRQNVIEEKLREQEITEGEAEILRFQAEKDAHADSLAELNRYYDEIKKADYLTEKERLEELNGLESQIRKTQSQVLTDTGKWTAKLREMMSNPDSFAGITSAYEMQKKNIEATYDAVIKTVGDSSEQVKALEKEKNRRLAVLNYEYLEQQWALQENAGLTWKDEYDRELNQLKLMHEQGIIDEKQYQKMRFELGVNYAKQYFDYYSGLSSSMFSAIQEAEIAASDAKYDVLIRQAKNNGEETAALEEEKENKKLDIQKKYADVDFAIKIAQIIADTSVAIMKAFAQLGPIAGAVASAMLTATGVAQVVAAKAERDKVMKMQASSSASGSSSIEGVDSVKNRVLTGYSEGGYTGDGDRLEVAGVVHKGEYVVPKPIMRDPRVVDAVGMIEAIRRRRMLAMPDYSVPAKGFADGGYTSSVALDVSELRKVVEELRAALKNLRAYVVLRDIEDVQRKRDSARLPFTKP